MSDLQTIFSTDPHKLSDQDFETLISAYRQARSQFVLGNTKAGKPESKKTAKEKETEALAKNLKLDLGDLSL